MKQMTCSFCDSPMLLAYGGEFYECAGCSARQEDAPEIVQPKHRKLFLCRENDQEAAAGILLGVVVCAATKDDVAAVIRESIVPSHHLGPSNSDRWCAGKYSVACIGDAHKEVKRGVVMADTM